MPVLANPVSRPQRRQNSVPMSYIPASTSIFWLVVETLHSSSFVKQGISSQRPHDDEVVLRSTAKYQFPDTFCFPSRLFIQHTWLP